MEQTLHQDMAKQMSKLTAFVSQWFVRTASPLAALGREERHSGCRGVVSRDWMLSRLRARLSANSTIARQIGRLSGCDSKHGDSKHSYHNGNRRRMDAKDHIINRPFFNASTLQSSGLCSDIYLSKTNVKNGIISLNTMRKYQNKQQSCIFD